MTYTAVDVHGFGGGFTLATVQAGFELIGKMSWEKGFGVYATLANRKLLGYGWESILGDAPKETPNVAPPAWDILPADFVFGNPPCSGFSTLSPQAFRGQDSSINRCMWQLVDYAAQVGPQIVAWESVQQTFRQGLPLMRQLHDRLEEVSGKKYWLYHVLHNNASVGGVSNRKRYFWVASQVPFGVDHNIVTRDGMMQPQTYVPTFNDMLLDLENLGLTMADQPYRGVEHLHFGHDDDEDCTPTCRTVVRHSSDWTRREIHDGSGVVDGHDVFHSPTLDRIVETCQLEPWAEGERMSDVLRRYYQRTGSLSDRSWGYRTKKFTPDGEVVFLSKGERLIETDFAMGHNQPARWHGDRLANVITGGACHLILHPHQDRTLTQREAARIQGFPDDWKIWPVRHVADLGPAWGKGVPVQAGRWIARWARAALDGEPGPDTGIQLEQYNKKLYKEYGPRDRESIMDLTYAYKPYLQVEDSVDTLLEVG